ncbi:MAG TPA: glycosyltransferase [Pyrinomonadaceae bacterium]|jgi:mannosyltransferase OCH1-like enzyme
MAAEADSNRIIQGLWIGAEMSVMEQLSVSSFLSNGHEYHLYVYDEMRNVPEGAVVKDAGEILPASSIFQYKHQASYAGFANFFRYKLLLERGGWWVDTDVVCLKPFDFAGAHVFATEMCRGEEVVTSGIIKAPVGSPVMAYAWEVCRKKNPQELVWGETGPRLMMDAVGRFSLSRCRQPFQVFCPLDYSEWHRVLEPDFEGTFGETTRAVHLWNEMWRDAGQDKNAEYGPACLYERLKRKYLRRRRGTNTSL